MNGSDISSKVKIKGLVISNSCPENRKNNRAKLYEFTIDFRANLCGIQSVNGREFKAKVVRLARKRGIVVSFDQTRGKGSHGTLYYGDRYTVMKDRKKPLAAGTFHGMCKQLGIDPKDLIRRPDHDHPIPLPC